MKSRGWKWSQKESTEFKGNGSPISQALREMAQLDPNQLFDEHMTLASRVLRREELQMFRYKQRGSLSGTKCKRSGKIDRIQCI